MKMKYRVLRKIGIIAACVVAFFGVSWLVLRFWPYPELKQFQARQYSVRYYDRDGMLLQISPLDDGLRREMPREIPQQVKDIFVFAEDGRFYKHWGVDLFSLARALSQNISKGRRVSGASTITMQLARVISDNANDTGSREGRRQTLGSKLTEMINALRLETRFSKDEILEMYINSLPFGFNTEGVTSASRTFFSSELSMLSPAQLFCLAVIPRRPNLYNPLDNPDNCAAAATELHLRFMDNKKRREKWPLFAQIDERDFEFALSSARRFHYPFELPHLIRHINAGLVSSGTIIGEMHLTIDLALQNYLEDAIAGNIAIHYLSRLTNGSAVVIDNETGEILAWVGSADFFNEESAGQIDGVLALNQPGSSMKPFLYAMALEKGFLPTDVIADVPMTFGEREVYIPRNFNDRFNGPILFRASLASSLNIPAVYLLYRLGVKNYSRLLHELGFDSLEKSAEDAGLGLALGNAPVSLLELVRAFSVFPRDGIYIPVTWQKETEIDEHRVFSVDSSRLICSFLSDSNARVLAFGSGRNFRTSFPAIFKTGTANQFQSIVALGASTQYSVGVWMGNFTGETVYNKTGSSLPAAIARNTLNVLHGVNPAARNQTVSGGHSDFPVPDNWKIKRICAVSGMDPTEACLAVINEYVHPEEDRSNCTWHQIINGRSETTYPAEYQAWFTASIRQGFLDYGSRPLEIINPRDGFVYLSSHGIGMDDIPVEVIGGDGDVLYVTHNNSTFTISRPFVFFLPREPGLNILRVKNGEEEEIVTFSIER
ncbi:MAG: transglycosylase domain-containing protein [Treponema sp.]|nr:transglycosylase domain-containing protein [Treponema sp.]